MGTGRGRSHSESLHQPRLQSSHPSKSGGKINIINSQRSVGFPAADRTPSLMSRQTESLVKESHDDPHLRFRVRYKSRRDRKCIMHKFDVSDMFTEIVAPQALTESTSESSDTRAFKEEQEKLCGHKCKLCKLL